MNLDVIVCGTFLDEKSVKLTNDLLRTLSTHNFNIHLIKEKEFRGKTLNEGIKFSGSRDVLIFGDDITLTDGWFQSLEQYKTKGDIIGFSMLYPNSRKIQDTGYDIVKIDNRITLEPRNRGKNIENIKRFGYALCDSVCGCTMFIKKKVLKRLNRFNLDGQNRWGEFIFTQQAKKMGFKVIVLGHFLYHEGKSTKSNKKLKYSSISWHKEKDIWKRICKKYIDERDIKHVYKRKLSRNLIELLKSKDKILIYGVGTIAELIAKNTDLKNINFCTGLKEEIGIDFFGKKTHWYKNINLSSYDSLIIATLNKPDVIYKNIRKIAKEKINIYKIKKMNKDKIFYYSIEQYSEV